MSSIHTRLSLFITVAAIGLAASSAVVLAQAPAVKGPIANGPSVPHSSCAQGETLFKDANGTDDSFATSGTADSKPHPIGPFVPTMTLQPATNVYDRTASNYHFGDSFTLPPGQITKLRLTTRLKILSGDANNDGISFSGKSNFTPGHFSLSIPALGVTSAGQLLRFDFDNPGSQIRVNGVAVAPGAAYATFYADLNASHLLHMYVQDDTSVDFVRIEGCVKPAPKYDLVATKKHDGNVYILNVTNAGSPLMPTGHVDVTEIVPAGLVIHSASGGPWQCPEVNFPVIGPDAFTCSLQIPSGGIPTGPLPPIMLKTEGTPVCPNCMKAKLYLKDFQGGAVPVNEGDMKNNASCTK